MIDERTIVTYWANTTSTSVVHGNTRCHAHPSVPESGGVRPVSTSRRPGTAPGSPRTHRWPAVPTGSARARRSASTTDPTRDAGGDPVQQAPVTPAGPDPRPQPEHYRDDRGRAHQQDGGPRAAGDQRGNRLLVFPGIAQVPGQRVPDVVRKRCSQDWSRPRLCRSASCCASLVGRPRVSAATGFCGITAKITKPMTSRTKKQPVLPRPCAAGTRRTNGPCFAARPSPRGRRRRPSGLPRRPRGPGPCQRTRYSFRPLSTCAATRQPVRRR